MAENPFWEQSGGNPPDFMGLSFPESNRPLGFDPWQQGNLRTEDYEDLPGAYNKYVTDFASTNFPRIGGLSPYLGAEGRGLGEHPELQAILGGAQQINGVPYLNDDQFGQITQLGNKLASPMDKWGPILLLSALTAGAGAAGAGAAGAAEGVGASAGAGAFAGEAVSPFAAGATGLGDWSVGTTGLLGMSPAETAAISGAGFSAPGALAGGPADVLSGLVSGGMPESQFFQQGAADPFAAPATGLGDFSFMPGNEFNLSGAVPNTGFSPSGFTVDLANSGSMIPSAANGGMDWQEWLKRLIRKPGGIGGNRNNGTDLLSSLASLVSGGMGMRQSNQMGNLAGPGNDAAAQLQALMRDPSQVTQTPQYQALLKSREQGMSRRLAAQGYNLSGNERASLAELGGAQFAEMYGQEIDRLGRLVSGAQAPATAQAQLKGNSLNRLIYGGLGLADRFIGA